MAGKLFLSIALILTVSPLIARGEGQIAEQMGNEVSHLLSFVETSDCLFLRNNTTHTSVQARQHIERKLNHIKAKITSTEDFIRYAASKSSITGQRYLVDCGDGQISSQQWLMDELLKFRKSALEGPQ